MQALRHIEANQDRRTDGIRPQEVATGS